MGIENLITHSSVDNDVPLNDGCPDSWTWNHLDKSPEVRLLGSHHEIVHFHPNWSNGTAGVRGTRPLRKDEGCVQYWEVRISRRLFGTSMMLGIAATRARLHADSFINLLGEDEHSWALSHKGLLWHNGECRQYTAPFRENETTTIGMKFDARRGTLSYYKDGLDLGVAFTGLNHCWTTDVELYPAVCSTAAKTEMILLRTLRSYENLQDRCRASVVKCLRGMVEGLPLPGELKKYVSEGMPPTAEPGVETVARSERVRLSEIGVELSMFRKRVKQQLLFS